MSEHQDIPEPGEMVYVPRPSWAPVFFGFAVAAMVVGIYGEGFMVRGWIYSIIGIVVFLFAFRTLVRSGIRDYFSLPRKQRVRGAVLPVETISPPQP
ncbi:MAG TPA: hypothetical protein VII45_02995 [Solirubrobacterales bacterium]